MKANTQITKIYALKCPNDNKIKYVGKTTQTLEQRLLGHISTAISKITLRGKHEWIRSLLLEGKRPIVVLLEECENWVEREKHWISFYKEREGVLHNQSEGGEDWVFDTHNIPWNKGGGKYTPEMIENMSKAKLGKKALEETKKKMSESAKGKPKSPNVGKSTVARLSKPIQQFDLQGNFIKEYTSASEAARQLGSTDWSTIAACARGSKRAKTARGFLWKYKQ